MAEVQALVQHGAAMPSSRRLELVNLIKLFLGRDPSSEPPCLQPGDLVAARTAGVRGPSQLFSRVKKESTP